MIIRLDCNDTISLYGPSADRLPTWTQWMRVGVRKMWQDVLRVATLAALWSERHAERTRLLSLDDRMLKDIGLSRADAWSEGSKPVWRL
jgi:Uncharacterized conserved small protein